MDLEGEENGTKLQILPQTHEVEGLLQIVSLENFTANNAIASGAPKDEDETSRIFVDGLDIGYFREKNGCDKYPTVCGICK
jgi:hypothetical protein